VKKLGEKNNYPIAVLKPFNAKRILFIRARNENFLFFIEKILIKRCQVFEKDGKIEIL